MNQSIERTFCGRMDHGGCGLLVHLKNGRVIKIQGDPDSHTGGYICPKGRAHPERLYHPDRLLYPQVRIGERGKNRWRRISWDDALERISDKLLECRERSGAERAMFMQGTPKGLEHQLLQRLARSYGSPNVAGTGTVCFAPRSGAAMTTNGYYPHPDLEDYPEAIMVWGANPFATSPDSIMAPHLTAALNQNPKLIVIDPVRTTLAARADLWLRIWPGTDGLLALGMIKVMIEEGLYDQTFVRDWTTGFDELKAHVSSFSFNEIEGKTKIPLKNLKKAARAYAEARSGCLLWGNAIDHNINSVQTARALVILMALTGNLDRPGGNGQASLSGILNPAEFTLKKKYQDLKGKGIGRDFKLSSSMGFVPYHIGMQAILTAKPYPIEFLYLQATNPVLSHPNSRETLQALQRVGFLVVSELFMTPTARFADILLPVATHMEFNDLGYYGLPWGKIMARPKMVDPPGECLSDVNILNALGRRLDLDDPFWEDEESCINHILKPSGLTFYDLVKKGLLEEETVYEKYKEHGFKTPSGKVELYSSWMKDNGLAPLPVFDDLPDGHSRGEDLILTSLKRIEFFHSTNRNLPSLRKRRPEPVVLIHPETAKERRIESEAWVWIESKQGRAKFKARYDGNLHPRVIVAEHGWWFPESDAHGLYEWKISNLNRLTSNTPPYEPSIGTVNLRGLPCKMSRVMPVT